MPIMYAIRLTFFCFSVTVIHHVAIKLEEKGHKSTNDLQLASHDGKHKSIPSINSVGVDQVDWLAHVQLRPSLLYWLMMIQLIITDDVNTVILAMLC